MEKHEFPPDYVPLTLDDFEVPPPPKIGDKSREDIYLEIGRSLTQWALIDFALTHLYTTLIHPEPQFFGPAGTAAWRSFGSLISPLARIDAIGEAANESLSSLPHHLTDVKAKLKIIKKAAARRNEIAHSIVAEFEGHGCLLVPHWHNPKKFKMNQPGPLASMTYRYSSVEIGGLSEKFSLLLKETSNLSLDVSDELRAYVEKLRQRSLQIAKNLNR